jgi:hypothetical protein
MSANILQENLDLLLTEFGVGILNDSAALRRVVDITSTNNTSATLNVIDNNGVTITELPNAVSFIASSNSLVITPTNNSTEINNTINEVV